MPNSDPATARQHKELRRLAERTGTSFTYPRTVAEASAEIGRMRALKGTHRGVRAAERQAVSRGLQEPSAQTPAFRHDEVEGYGSSATWRGQGGAR